MSEGIPEQTFRTIAAEEDLQALARRVDVLERTVKIMASVYNADPNTYIDMERSIREELPEPQPPTEER